MTATISLSAEAACLAFARWVIRECVFDGRDLDGGDVQDKAVELGLLIEAKYDPAVHGEIEDADPGDPIFVFSDKLEDKIIEPRPPIYPEEWLIEYDNGHGKNPQLAKEPLAGGNGGD